MKEYTFNPVSKRDNLIKNLSDYAKSSGFKDVILGISGGKDSTVAAAICARALGAEHVYGVLIPDDKQSDINDSIRVCNALKINHLTVNIGYTHKELIDAILNNENQNSDYQSKFDKDCFEVEYDKESDINVAPRLRMTVLRYIGQMLGARLVGTGNLSESIVGYCTKDGDTSCDFSLLGSFTSIEVVQIGLTMEEIPKDLVEKTPSDGLSGQPDEERIGVTYQQIHDFIRLGTSGDKEVDKIIEHKKNLTRHKREMPIVLRAL